MSATYTQLKNVSFLLGSKSPRRRELLKQMDLNFDLIEIDSDEDIDDHIQPENAARFLAEKKSGAYTEDLGDHILITADTVVLCDGDLMNKPADNAEAEEMLRKLSNNEHLVITGVALRSADRLHSFDCTTRVRFGDLNSGEIEYYIEQYKPFDKAGGYGIQEWIGMIGVREITGCYYNVMGLPTSKLYSELCDFIK